MIKARQRFRADSISRKLSRGDELFRLAEAALRRTEELHVTEWNGALIESRDLLRKAITDYESQVRGQDPDILRAVLL
jgi:hypothetical protein